MLGGAKVYLETAESYRNLGHDVTVIGIEDIFPEYIGLNQAEIIIQFPPILKKYIQENIQSYDAVEYEYYFLPYERHEFPRDKLLIARSVLLIHHLDTVKIPAFKTIRSYVGKLIKGKKRKEEAAFKLTQANKTLESADLISVPNNDDKNKLIQHGHSGDKIIFSPYGLFDDRISELQNIKQGSLKCPVITFVGTFDCRKGAVEFPDIVRGVAKNIPEVKFKFLGTSAMFPTEESVLNYFPKDLRKYLEVTPKFGPEELPRLLEGSTLGIFPSYFESFGFGLLEMVSALIPSIAYETMGPNTILPKELLVPRGDHKQLISKINQLLLSENEYKLAKDLIREVSEKFLWDEINKKTLKIYQDKLNEIKTN